MADMCAADPGAPRNEPLSSTCLIDNYQAHTRCQECLNNQVSPVPGDAIHTPRLFSGAGRAWLEEGRGLLADLVTAMCGHSECHPFCPVI